MRRLWTDHVVWTREYVVAAVAGTPDADATAKRLMQNREEIGRAIVPFYGQAAGDKLTELLKQHMTIAVERVKAAKMNDQGAHTPCRTFLGGTRRDMLLPRGSFPLRPPARLIPG